MKHHVIAGRHTRTNRHSTVRRQSAVLAAAGAVVLLHAGDAWAGTEVQFNAGTALTTAGNYSSTVVPTNTTDVRLTTASGTGLSISSASVIMESVNVTNGSNYVISNQTSTATNRTLTLGNPAGFTNAVSGVIGDLIYTGGSSGTLTLQGTNTSTGTGSLGLTLTSAGNFNINTTLTINAVITGTDALTKTGTGTLVLGNNSNSGTLVLPTGGLVLNAGTLQINGGGALGSVANGGGVTLTGNATLRNSGTSATAGIGSTRTLAIGTNNLTLDSAGNSFNVNGAITGTTGNVTVLGTGVVGFTNVNTYTGTTVVTGSTNPAVPSGLTLSNTNSSSGYTVSNATLTLTSAGSFTGTPSIGLTNSSFVVGAGRAATLGLGGLTISGGGNLVTAGSAGVDLGAITRTAGTVDFTLPASGSLTTTSANTASGILGGWATVNSGAAFATSAGNGVTPGAITAFNGGSTNYATAGAATNFDAAASGTFASSTVNSIRITAPSTVTLAGAFSVASGGVLVTPTAGASGSTVTGGTSLTSGGGELFVHQYNPAAPLTLATPIVDNGGSVSLVKTGTGTLILSGTSTNTGVTTISAGTLQIGNGSTGALGPAAIVDNGVLSFNLPGTVTTSVGISGGGSVQQDGPGTLVFAAGTGYSGGTTVNNGGIQFATTNNAGVGAFRINNGFLRQTAALTSGRTFTLGTAASTVDVSSGFIFNISGLVTGPGTLNVNSLTTLSTTGVADTGQLSLSNATNTYTGGTVLNAGILQPYFGTSLGTGPLTVNNNTRVIFNNVSSTANTASAFGGNITLNGTADTFQFGNGTFRNTLTFTGNVSGPAQLVQTGPGTLTLAQTGNNSYTGGTVVNQGLLIGAAGSFGTGDLTINPTSLTNGTAGLIVDAAGVISTNAISPTANVTVSANTTNNPGITGSLTLVGATNPIGTLSGNGQVVVTGATLTVGTGTAAATSTTFSGVISGTTGSLVKVGAGTQVLTGANTYTGTTTVQGGTLSVKTNAAGGIAAAPLLTGAGGADIQNGSVVFDYTGDTTPVAQIRTLLAASFNDPTTVGVMDTGQLRSTTATAKRGLGYADTGTTVIVKAALFGDADLDGGVAIGDFNTFAGNFGKATGQVWTGGDFDYDGGVGINDFNLLAGNFGQSLPASSEGWASLLAFAAANNDMAAFQAVTGVPEPTTLGVVAAGATLGLRRRRR